MPAYTPVVRDSIARRRRGCPAPRLCDSEEKIMKKLACGQVVAGCDGVVIGAIDDEVLTAAAEHVATAHGMSEVPYEVVAAIRAGITDV